MSLFVNDVNDWDSWGKLFQDVDVWEPLIQYIFQKETLPYSKIELLTPGTNAVFKVGDFGSV